MNNYLSRYFSIIGSKALWGYIMHLIIIGACFSFGLIPQTAGSTWLFIAFLSLINFLYAYYKKLKINA